jgi:hypothetical protein
MAGFNLGQANCFCLYDVVSRLGYLPATPDISQLRLSSISPQPTKLLSLL